MHLGQRPYPVPAVRRAELSGKPRHGAKQANADGSTSSRPPNGAVRLSTEGGGAPLAVGTRCPRWHTMGRTAPRCARAAVRRDPVAMELLATTGDAFVRVGASTRLQGSGAQCLALDGDTVYVGCRGGGLKRSADGGDTVEDVPLPEQEGVSVAVGGGGR